MVHATKEEERGAALPLRLHGPGGAGVRRKECFRMVRQSGGSDESDQFRKDRFLKVFGISTVSPAMCLA